MSGTSTKKPESYRLLILVGGVVGLLDWLSKAWIANNLEINSYYPPEAITVIEGFFYVVYIVNEGAAWGMLSGQTLLLSVISFLALLGIYIFRHRLELHHRPNQWAFGLLIGGILGNLTDRLIHGYVIDFLDFHFPFSIPLIMPTGRYPSFNIADCGIVIGTLLYIYLSFRNDSRSACNK